MKSFPLQFSFYYFLFVSMRKKLVPLILNKAMIDWFAGKYLPTMAEAKNSKISLVNTNLKGLPPTTIITAEIDPLNSDGIMHNFVHYFKESNHQSRMMLYAFKYNLLYLTTIVANTYNEIIS